MKTLTATVVGQRKNPRVVAAALLAAGAVGGWAMSTTITTNATAFEDLGRIEAAREKLPLEASKPSLIGSYVVTGTDSDGKRYAGPGIVGIALAPSGALELEWDNGKQVGVGEVIGNVLAVACLTKGRTANPAHDDQSGWFPIRQVVASDRSRPQGHRDVEEGLARRGGQLWPGDAFHGAGEDRQIVR